ncbi:hypothetical protein V2G26_002419 [Clonostachys chloroleuca]
MILNLSSALFASSALALSMPRDIKNPVYEFPPSVTPAPIEVKFDDNLINQMIQKVRSYRPSKGFDEGWSDEGPSESIISGLSSFWADHYDWRATQKQINDNFTHYAVTVPGNRDYQEPIPLHFIHHRSDASNATPLLLVHGWPSSHLEWAKVIGPLTQKGYHVVAVDLPGFGFSPAPTKPGMGPREMGGAFDALMLQLGYEKYGLVSTDLGWIVGMWMVNDSSNIIGHFTDFYWPEVTKDDLDRQAKNETTPEENAWINSSVAWANSHSAYSTLHVQKPLAAALTMADSPVGFAGWMWDLTRTANDGYPDDFQDIITDTLMLWFPGPFANIRSYRTVYTMRNFPRTEVPTGFSAWGFAHGPFPEIKDINFAPKHVIERAANLVFYNRHERGGHFPAKTEPELWLADVEKFFSGL